jgi:hypothetical protein
LAPLIPFEFIPVPFEFIPVPLEGIATPFIPPPLVPVPVVPVPMEAPELPPAAPPPAPPPPPAAQLVDATPIAKAAVTAIISERLINRSQWSENAVVALFSYPT